MRKWKKMDATAKELGRGLGQRELVDRVAQEVGASHYQVRAVLKATSANRR